MSRSLTYTKALVTGGLFVGFGYALMKYSTPTEEEFYMKLPPGFRKEEDKEKTRERTALMMEIVKKVAGSDKPSW
ncbi:5876_t:CDS:2 [Diversispora eburnea]|uniref:5876_t:CDS:1 n=1 Tax=Diversispora eburnea TaxID=1213867 RepID=A0A9N8WI89_9GLOM|nr:5876_t:CDS:2 [Diversispora eburnea]